MLDQYLKKIKDDVLRAFVTLFPVKHRRSTIALDDPQSDKLTGICVRSAICLLHCHWIDNDWLLLLDCEQSPRWI
jgi:hypothetical protein